jgi:5-methylcytosine-specific restriction endonuclease McrA
MAKKKEPKLTIELVPATCWYSNVRSELPTKEWDRLRKESYAHAEYKCEICGESGKDQGYNHALECHEIWDYNDTTKVQTLKGLISLCPRCHQVKHIGRSTILGKQGEALAHLEKVNGWNHKQAVDYLAESFIIHSERSKHEWKLNINSLNEDYGVDKKLLTGKKRTKTKPPWAKKKRRRGTK